jgi:hypothetical protein
MRWILLGLTVYLMYYTFSYARYLLREEKNKVAVVTVVLLSIAYIPAYLMVYWRS